MQTKLILFEGNPFTGKSTLSEYVAQQLALNGHAVEWRRVTTHGDRDRD